MYSANTDRDYLIDNEIDFIAHDLDRKLRELDEQELELIYRLACNLLANRPQPNYDNPNCW